MLSIHCVTHLAVFRFEIVCLEKSFTVYQAETCRQAHRTTEANFTCPLRYQTSIFTFPRSTVVCPGQWNLGFFLPCMTYDQSFLSFNCIISECGQLSLHMKNTRLLKYMLQVKIFTWICDTTLFVADYQRFRVKWTNNVN